MYINISSLQENDGFSIVLEQFSANSDLITLKITIAGPIHNQIPYPSAVFHDGHVSYGLKSFAFDDVTATGAIIYLNFAIPPGKIISLQDTFMLSFSFVLSNPTMSMNYLMEQLNRRIGDSPSMRIGSVLVFGKDEDITQPWIESDAYYRSPKDFTFIFSLSHDSQLTAI